MKMSGLIYVASTIVHQRLRNDPRYHDLLHRMHVRCNFRRSATAELLAGDPTHPCLQGCYSSTPLGTMPKMLSKTKSKWG